MAIYSGDVNYGANSVTLAVAAPGLPGDFNQDGIVDAADYVLWRKTDGTPEGYDQWRANFDVTASGGAAAGSVAAVPEPSSSLVLLLLATIGGMLRQRRS